MKRNSFITPVFMAALAIAMSTAFSDDLREELIVIKSPEPAVTAGDYGTHYLFFDFRGHKNVYVFLSEVEAKRLGDLPDGREYAFRIWFSERSILGIRDLRFPFAELASVSDEVEIVIDRSECRLHKITMKRGLAEIHYGFPSQALFDTYDSFSGGPGFVLGGCVVGPDSPKKEFAYICAKCVEAYESWKKKAANKPVAGNAGTASRLADGHHLPGAPEPGRAAHKSTAHKPHGRSKR